MMIQDRSNYTFSLVNSKTSLFAYLLGRNSGVAVFVCLFFSRAAVIVQLTD